MGDTPRDDDRQAGHGDAGGDRRGDGRGAETQTHGTPTLQVARRGLFVARRSLRSPNRNARSAVALGRLLGIAFLLCFGTGLYSHFLQDPLPWMRFPTRPVQLYQVTQGIHITAGIAIIPLLLGKLNSVMPALAQYPPVRGVLHLLERLSIAVLISGAIVQVGTGLVNTFQWYPWPFSFRQTHYALAYLVIGALVVHIAVKLRIIVRYWRARDSYDEHGRFVVDRSVGSELVPDGPDGQEARHASATPAAVDRSPAPAAATHERGLVGRLTRWIDGADAPVGNPTVAHEPVDRVPVDPEAADGRPVDRVPADRAPADGRRQRLARRGFFGGIAAATVGVVALTVGQSSKIGEPFNVFAPRQRGLGPNGLPVNKTARQADVHATALAADWVLTVAGPTLSRTFSRAELTALGMAESRLPISCVEGWSQVADWKGVRMRDLLAAVQADPASGLRITSLQRSGGYRVTEMGPEYASDPATLVALELNGATLDLDHGFPARIIAPGRPGVLQTKWLSRIEVIS